MQIEAQQKKHTSKQACVSNQNVQKRQPGQHDIPREVISVMRISKHPMSYQDVADAVTKKNIDSILTKGADNDASDTIS